MREPGKKLVHSTIRSVLLAGAAGVWNLLYQREAAEKALEHQRHMQALGEMSAVLAHEIRNSDDIYFPVLGPVNSNVDNAPTDDANPVNGIALDEIFSYEITQRGARIDVIVRRGDRSGPIIGHNYVDMQDRNSGYDVPTEWMYFKAGAYSQNSTGDGTDFDQVTFYELDNSHDAYVP